jgi:hypothetical protein
VGTSLQIECWGAGSGGSGQISGNAYGSAGGGGAYAKGTYTTATADYTTGVSFTVGAGSAGVNGANSVAGGDTSWGSSVVLAKGASGTSGAGTGGVGGSSTNSVGATTKNAGGNGAVWGSATAGAGGGGAGGSSGAGNAGTTAGVGGQGDSTSGGAGGARATSGSNTNPGTSNVLGGGGGGGEITATSGQGGFGGYPGGGGGNFAVVGTGLGGNGADGQIQITFNITQTTPALVLLATQNIHYNLTAWTSNTAVSTVGTRWSSNGCAYQATTTGTTASTGTSALRGPCGTGTSITDGTVTWKFLSPLDVVGTTGPTLFTNWLATIPTTLTQAVTGWLWNNSTITTTSGTAFLSLTGKTTTSSFTITLTCAAGESFRDTLAGQATALYYSTTAGVNFTLPSTASAINYFSVAVSNVTINGLMFKDPMTASTATIFSFSNSAAGNATIRNCLFEGVGQTGGTTMIETNMTTQTGSVLTMTNSVVVDRQTGSTAGATTSFNCATINIANCTFYAPNNPTAQKGVQGTTGVTTMAVKNCIIIGYANGDALGDGSISPAATNCLFSQSATTNYTPTNCIQSSSAASNFINTASDLRLLSTSPARDAGVTDTTDIPTSDDIAKTTRPQNGTWDIGAWEVVVNNYVRCLWMD